MVSNGAKLDRRTKQHTPFGVSVSHGSRDMARTKSWRKIFFLNEREQNHIASPTGIANYYYPQSAKPLGSAVFETKL